MILLGLVQTLQFLFFFEKVFLLCCQPSITSSDFFLSSQKHLCPFSFVLRAGDSRETCLLEFCFK